MTYVPSPPPISRVDPIISEYIGRELRKLAAMVVTYGDTNRHALHVGGVTSASYTVLPSDELIAVSLSGVSVVCHLPPVAQYPGRRLALKKLDAGAQTICFDANGSETIDGAATVSISVRYAVVQVVAGPTEWHRL